MADSSRLPDVQTWDAGRYDRNARFVSDLGGDVLALLDPRPGERILDLGCGDGALTERLVAAGASVLGVDVSEAMLAAARGRGLDVVAGDARTLPFEAEFDAVFSNAVLHWVTDPDKAAARMRAALKPGGRLVAEFGGHGNIAAIVTALRAAARIHGGDARLVSPWFYPTPAEYRAILEKAGFEVMRIGLHPRPTPLPTGIEGWLMTFRKPFFDQFGEDGRAEVLKLVVDLLAPSLRDAAGNWTADYVRLRVAARAS
ncbi:MAG: methyltransferase domain-containing protein [Hyphomicrobiaceae bacterium]